MDPIELRCAPFDYPYHVVLGDEARDEIFRKLGADAGGAGDRGGVHHFSEKKAGVDIFIVHLPKKRCVTTMFHEALHLVYAMLQLHGVPTGAENQELFCYMQEDIVAQIDAACYPKRSRTSVKSV